MDSSIPDSIWMWVLGGTCGIVILLVGVLGGFMLNSILKIKEELKLFRIEFAESKIDTVTWPKFVATKREMEKDRGLEIDLALSQHLEHHGHVAKSI